MAEKFRFKSGFSLVELMIVVGIIGIITSIAVPQAKRFIARTRQMEVKLNLSHLHGLQTLYFEEHNAFASLTGYGKQTNQTCNFPTNNLGFKLVGRCANIYYQYSSAGLNPFAEGDSQAFIYPGCSATDNWQISADKSLSFTTNALNNCN